MHGAHAAAHVDCAACAYADGIPDAYGHAANANGHSHGHAHSSGCATYLYAPAPGGRRQGGRCLL